MTAFSRRKVWSARNSRCNYPLDELDHANWWTDVWPDGHTYLHVKALDGDTVQRVRCRATDTPRLQMINGELYWLIDSPITDTAGGS